MFAKVYVVLYENSSDDDDVDVLIRRVVICALSAVGSRYQTA